MADGPGWFDGTARPDDATEIMPVVADMAGYMAADVAEEMAEGALDGARDGDAGSGAPAIRTGPDADSETAPDVGPSDLLKASGADPDEDVAGARVTGPAAQPSPGAQLGAAVSRRLNALAGDLASRLAALGAAVADRLPAVGRFLLARAPRLSMTIAAGLLLCASFPPVGWWWAAVPAFALLAGVLTRPATTPVGGLGYGLLFGLTFYVPLLPWISDLVGVPPWLTLATASALFPALFGLLAVSVRGLPGWPVWFAVLWAAQEWAKSVVPFGGFPWGSVGFGQTGGPFLPLVQLGGVPLLSAAIVLLGCCATAIALEIALWWQRGRRASGAAVAGTAGARADQAHTARDDAPPAVLLPGICICLVLFLTVVAWPPVRRAGVGAGNEPVVTVAAVQGNVPRLGLDFNAQRRAVLDNHVRETLRLADDVHAGRAAQPQFVIWPEDSSDIDPLSNTDAAAQITVAAQAIGAPILVGTVLEVADRLPDDPSYTNTVIVWDPGTGPSERHDKRIIQPFGEYLPWPWLFRHLSPYAGRAGHMIPGESTGVVHVAGIPVGVATCWEIVFDRAARESVLHGAQLLAAPTNNATFDKTMSEQQLVFAKVRAVELDRYVVVAGTTGISAVIAPDGREIARTDFFEPAYLDTQLRLKTSLTPAVRWGPILQWMLVGLGVAVVAVAVRQNGAHGRLSGRLTVTNRLRFRAAGEPAGPEGGPPDDSPGERSARPDEGGLTVDDDSPDDETSPDNQSPPDEGGRHQVQAR